ncbi:MAG: glycosyltransferase family 2 protein [Candidatus Daviesbacteria bacterium]|nr:MAG: glycosyltransferase family 2 protein [Candidatus Daviesbacteria bacterium]
MIKTYVVVLNYKVKKEVLECIKSLAKSVGFNKDFKVLVIDNNSADGSVEALKKKFPKIPLIVTQKNLGFTGGNNVGIKYVLERGAEYILILNPDTVVEKNAVENLLNETKKYQSGIIGPKIYFGTGKKIWYAGGILDMRNVLGKHRGVDELDSGQYNQAEETDYVTGAAMLISAKVFNKIGLFDERYFLYYEDADFCMRAKQAGFKVWYTPNSLIHHKNARSTGLGSPLQDYYITRNRMLFASKFAPFRTRFALFREALKNMGIPARRKALLDFLMGNFNEGNI